MRMPSLWVRRRWSERSSRTSGAADSAIGPPGISNVLRALEASAGAMIITVAMCSPMALAHSKVTAQGQVSVPAKVRQRLGVGPGSVLEWDEDGDRVN